MGCLSAKSDSSLEKEMDQNLPQQPDEPKEETPQYETKTDDITPVKDSVQVETKV